MVDSSILSEKELDIIHQEQGWIDNQERHDRIPFDSAFELKAI